MKSIFIALLLCTISFTTVSAQTANETDTVKTAVITVGNIHCGNDMPTIKKQLLNEEGIDDVSFTDIAGSSSVFTITYHSAATSQPRIEKAIESTPGCDDSSEMPYRVKKESGRKKKKS